MNDDVFADDDDEKEPASSDAASEMQPSSNFSQFKGINAGGVNVPDYLVDAVDRYLRANGGKQRNSKIPFSASISREVSSLSRQIYRPSGHSLAISSVWQVLDEITNGQVSIKYRLLELEEKIAAYAYLSNFVNRIYSELEEHVDEEGYEETTRLAGMLLVYFDILCYHREFFLQEYYEFCQLQEIQPKESIYEHSAYEHSMPGLLENFILYKLHNPEDDAVKGSMNEFFNDVMTNVAEYLRRAIFAQDRSSLEKE